MPTGYPHSSAEILEHGIYGKLVPPGQSEALAEAIIKALEEPADVAFLQERANEYALTYVGKLYRQVLLDDDH